jgi:DNA adenine methylase
MTIQKASSPEMTPEIVPFLKWAGGKRWFAQRHRELVPASFKRYIEPFIGSGALFFALQPQKAVLADLNEDLVNCYRAICADPAGVQAALQRHQELHCDTHYYKTRGNKPLDLTERAAWFIYLNRTCWNGLYRVNQRNEFNVPIGTKTQVILPTDNFARLKDILLRARILHSDFEAVIDSAEEGDFVFVDPPYTVKHNLNGFIKYNDRLFSWADQVRLRNSVAAAAERGAYVLVTNANHESVRELYTRAGAFEVISRASVLAASSAHRTRTDELIIRTWVKSSPA